MDNSITIDDVYNLDPEYFSKHLELLQYVFFSDHDDSDDDISQNETIVNDSTSTSDDESTTTTTVPVSRTVF